MKSVLTLIILSLATGVLAGSLDSLIVECKIMDAENSEPVVAKVRYESLPYGSKLGLRTDSTVNIRIDYDEKYTVRVEANGYEPEVFEVDFHTYGGITHIIEEVKLKKGLVEGALLRLESLNFPQASAAITSDAHAELDELVATMQKNPTMIIQLEGHTDFSGDARANMKLSKDRVDAVKNYLVTKGVSKDRIMVEAFGGEKPLTQSRSPEGMAMNRRVEVRVIKK